MWTARVSSAAKGRADVFVRRHRFEVGAALEFDRDAERVSALEYVLGAIGADVVDGLRAAARRRRVAVDEIEAVVEGEVDNPLTFLGVVGEEGHPGVARVRVKVYASAFDPAEEVRGAWDEALDRSPLVRTFLSALELELQVI